MMAFQDNVGNDYDANDNVNVEHDIFVKRPAAFNGPSKMVI